MFSRSSPPIAEDEFHPISRNRRMRGLNSGSKDSLDKILSFHAVRPVMFDSPRQPLPSLSSFILIPCVIWSSDLVRSIDAHMTLRHVAFLRMSVRAKPMHPQNVYNRHPPFPPPQLPVGGRRAANKFASSAAVAEPGSPAQAVRGAHIRSECNADVI